MAPAAKSASKHQSYPHKKSGLPRRRDSFRWIARPTFLLPDSATNSPSGITQSTFSREEPATASSQRPQSAPNPPLIREGHKSISPIPRYPPSATLRKCQCIPPPRPPRPEEPLPNLRPKIILRPSTIFPQDFRVPTPIPSETTLYSVRDNSLNRLPDTLEEEGLDYLVPLPPQSPLSPSMYSRSESFYPSPSTQHRYSFDRESSQTFQAEPPTPRMPTLSPLVGPDGDMGFYDDPEAGRMSPEHDSQMHELIESKEKIMIAIEEAHHGGVWLDAQSWNFCNHRTALIFAAIVSILLVAGGITAGLVITLTHN